MGTITTKGKAERHYECDQMSMSISFFAKGTDPSVLSERVMKECEKFIREITEKVKINTSVFHIEDDKVIFNIYNNDNSVAKRVIKIKTPYDMIFQNIARKILDDGKYNYSIDVDYEYSKANDLHADLVTEALQEANVQAEKIANKMGLRVDELKKAEEEGDRYTPTGVICLGERERGIANASEYEESDKLSGCLKKMAVQVTAEWKIK